MWGLCWLSLSLFVVVGLQTGECSHHKRMTKRWKPNMEQRWKHSMEYLLAALNAKDDTDRAKYSDENVARRWMEEENEMLKDWTALRALAEWNFVTDISNETENVLLAVEKKYSKWYMGELEEGMKFDTRNFDPDLQRQFGLFTLTSDAKEPEVRERISQLITQMETIYNTATVCDLPGYSDCLSLEPELQDLMANSRDPELLKAVWQGWRDAAGRPMRYKYWEFVEASNHGAVQNGYHDFGEAWRASLFYDTEDLQSMVKVLWRKLRPLYLQLHAYVRRRLREVYGEQVVGSDGTIPAHLLGNMWSQDWEHIYPLVTPYPDASEDGSYIDSKLKEKYDVRGLFKLAEAFYNSLGMYNMTDKFWQNSMLVRPENRQVQCHASASDMFSHDDFRIKMCTEVNTEYLETVHHEMGHVEYYMAYAHQPAIYRDGANCAFHEAVGDTISLSVLSRKHLRLLGLDAGTEVDQYKQAINDLLKMALFKIAFLPFGLLVDRWRWQVFSGQTKPNKFNHDWWLLRLDLQGIRAPVPRSEQDFDPGAKFHVPSNSPYVCYFVSFVAQFQFYKALCEASGHSGPLHTCDFYGSAEAGEKFLRMLELGASRPWQEAMKLLTGTHYISADALLEYFQPLQQWLQEDNILHGERPGWKGATINWEGN